MGNRIAILISSGERSCFEHALIKACEFRDRGREVVIMIEGGAVARIAEYSGGEMVLSDCYDLFRREGVIAGVCGPCAKQHGLIEEAKRQRLPLINHHPSEEFCREKGYEVLVLLPRACNYCETWDGETVP